MSKKLKVLTGEELINSVFQAHPETFAAWTDLLVQAISVIALGQRQPALSKIPIRDFFIVFIVSMVEIIVKNMTPFEQETILEGIVFRLTAMLKREEARGE